MCAHSGLSYGHAGYHSLAKAQRISLEMGQNFLALVSFRATNGVFGKEGWEINNVAFSTYRGVETGFNALSMQTLFSWRAGRTKKGL